MQVEFFIFRTLFCSKNMNKAFEVKKIRNEKKTRKVKLPEEVGLVNSCWKCNFPMTRSVRRSVGRLVCHNFPRGGELPSTLLSEHLKQKIAAHHLAI